ncbi:MAG: lipid-A-disaccharide synthase [Candidatus Paracaedimonas acanthamoebae]|uniref:Lipid-A-disaccharide synthase n=1 Tax=Candidatus Paracaedimonas acanthamoebae TaxID=244581 RepID=A0A8J7PYV2_9PROT|nr:lipid-A-disaccharide synthase [Candidatus Paracaedimonas acanthamoebae]
MKAPHIYLVAGEASGDILGSRLIKALKEKSPHCIISGIGGALMAQQGLHSLFPLQELSIMGILEVLPHIPRILKRLNDTEQDILLKKPDIVITIDAKGFSFRLAKRLKKYGFPLVHYTAPSVWAWRPKRAQQIARFLDHLLVLFPFEPPYFEKVGLPTTFVGHPLIEEKFDTSKSTMMRKKFSLEKDKKLICLLPGSRTREVYSLLPIFIEALQQFTQKIKNFHVVIPTLPHFETYIRQEMEKTNLKFSLITDEHEKYQAMIASDAAIAASGTVTLELGLTQTPFLVAYKVNPLTALILKRLMRIPYVCMVNILLNKPLIGEFIQKNCRPNLISDHLYKILQKDNNHTLRQELATIRGLLTNKNKQPSKFAAETIFKILKKYQGS